MQLNPYKSVPSKSKAPSSSPHTSLSLSPACRSSAMSSSASSVGEKRGRRQSASPSQAYPSAVAAAAPLLQAGALPLVPCPCCGFRNMICCVSQSSANPGRVYYKCPNHRVSFFDFCNTIWQQEFYLIFLRFLPQVSPNPCNHYY